MTVFCGYLILPFPGIFLRFIIIIFYFIMFCICSYDTYVAEICPQTANFFADKFIFWLYYEDLLEDKSRVKFENLCPSTKQKISSLR
jgi:hypothetical protein